MDTQTTRFEQRCHARGSMRWRGASRSSAHGFPFHNDVFESRKIGAARENCVVCVHKLKIPEVGIEHISYIEAVVSGVLMMGSRALSFELESDSLNADFFQIHVES